MTSFNPNYRIFATEEYINTRMSLFPKLECEELFQKSR
ncbi:hypothetical protein LEP1GSC021_2035 [Leptospira noguchii str. 1993005606]|uniref:Uncharacterized protein n=2 Tax=Leptospira noguchii TaxID=28182 RepID=M6URZ2_9LEPT|nr:hypothetical protein LEP1GSC035_3657 [Leptospira noguchii str. 2007001578]EMO40013.1 hypothetical protein LEP1GSC186_1327 [Leptospira noguchii serovar Autumnalis str. ZUN142]EMS85020.1 hypothetical protein LEP1GSC074_1720 [Leptospira noguchii str. Hook]EMS85028.1 hypothetical protein LEP1GSC073_4071 [Leptospira noguchii str. Cascata]EPE86431.1 hypothetical protein LEP1GSC021_2035 [Leptospira noguchii str. 1993005606]